MSHTRDAKKTYRWQAFSQQLFVLPQKKKQRRMGCQYDFIIYCQNASVPLCRKETQQMTRHRPSLRISQAVSWAMDYWYLATSPANKQTLSDSEPAQKMNSINPGNLHQEEWGCDCICCCSFIPFQFFPLIFIFPYGWCLASYHKYGSHLVTADVRPCSHLVLFYATL